MSVDDVRHTIEAADVLPDPSAAGAGPQSHELVLPAPTDPMAVARRFVDRFHALDRVLHLRSWRGGLYTWRASHWVGFDLRSIRSQAYHSLESASYLKENGDIAQWSPNRHKLDDLIDALHAVTHLTGSDEPPFWIDKGQAGPGGPGDHAMYYQVDPAEVVSVANGLLHVPTRTLMPHSPLLFAHHSLPFAFDHDAPDARHWVSFLESLWPDDFSSIAALQEIFGYILSGDTRLQEIVLIVVGHAVAVRALSDACSRGCWGHITSRRPPWPASSRTSVGNRSLTSRLLWYRTPDYLGERMAK